MHYLLFYDVVDNYAEKRTAFRKDHIAHAQAAVARGELVLGGALANPVDGTLLLFKSGSPAVAELFAQTDPYVINGLVTRWRVREWTTVVGTESGGPPPVRSLVPTIFSHALAATAAGQWFSSGHASNPGSRAPSPRFWIWTALCAMLPDADVIGFSFGVRYDDMFGHRGFTHSVFFAAMVGAVAAWQIPSPKSQSPTPNRAMLFLWFSAVTLSHGLLDAMTNGGRGIGFLAPFSNERYFFPWRPIQVSPIGVGFFSARGLRVLVSECGWIWLPSAIMAASARLFKRG